jgi:N-acetylneuraminic acid mutarotase
MKGFKRPEQLVIVTSLLAFIAIAAVAFAGAGVGANEDTATQPAGPGAWSTAQPAPIYRSEMAAAVLNGRIYVAGGLAGPSPIFTGTTYAMQSYDAATNSWRDETAVPERLHHLGMAALEGRIYITGGYTGEDFNPDNPFTWVFDPTTNLWSRAADMPAPRAAHASVALDGLLYVVGGVGPNSHELWAYNPATNSWDRTRAPLPTLREHLTAAGVNGKLYVIGGRWSGGNQGTLEEYDPAANSWTSRPLMPTARGGLTSSVVNGRIHVTGGEDLFTSKTYNQHEVYDPSTNTWAVYPPMPTPRHGLPSGTVNSRWYVIGGGLQAGGQTYQTLSNIVEVWDPSGATPTPTSTSVPSSTPPPSSTPASTGTTTPVMPSSTPGGATTTPPPPSPTPTLCTLTFTDVGPNHTFYADIRCLVCRLVISGYSDGTFRPGNSITRGQISKVVSNAAGFNDPVSGQTYADVLPTNTFYEWIERLSGRGIMSGYPCGDPGEPCDEEGRPYFRTGADATRGQLSKIVSNAAGFNDPVSGVFYTDVPLTHTFYTEIMRLTDRGVMSGYPCGTLPHEPCDTENRPYFRPGNPVTRGQASKIVANTFFPACQTP